MDGDGLTADEEVIYGTDPANPDTDQDFLADGDEVNVWGTWPLRESHDGDRYDDGQEVLGFSHFGLGELGGDMPGYVLAPGDDVFVAAYPKIDFEVRDNIEMQASVETTIGSSTMTTETQTKSTMQRSVVITSKGEESNYIYGNQALDNPDALALTQAEVDSAQPSIIGESDRGSSQVSTFLITTDGMSTADLSFGSECPFGNTNCIGDFETTNIQFPIGAESSESNFVTENHPGDDLARLPFSPTNSECMLYDKRGAGLDLIDQLRQVEERGFLLWGPDFWVGSGGASKDQEKFVITAGALLLYGGYVLTTTSVALLAEDAITWWGRRDTKNLRTALEDAVLQVEVERWESNDCAQVFMEANRAAASGLAYTLPQTHSCRIPCIDEVIQWAGQPTQPPGLSFFEEDLPDRIFVVEDSSSVDWVTFLASQQAKISESANTTGFSPMSDQYGTPGPFGFGSNITHSRPDFGTGVVQTLDDSRGFVVRRFAYEDEEGDDGDDDDSGETSRSVKTSRTELNETIVTDTHSWSVTKEDWESTTTNSADFGTVTFSFNVSNDGTDMALDTAGLRFNLFVGDNPETTEVEDFNPITFPPIQDPAITFSNVGPGDELLFGATLSLQMQQFRALDEGASLKIAVADYSYGSDELYYRSAAGGGVRFVIDNGVLEPAATRHEEYLVPVHQVWDADLGRLREPTYGETLSQVVEVTHDDGILRSINNRAITGSAWWSMMLTTPTDASLFYKSTALEGQTVRMEYHGDADGDAYADSVELEHGTAHDDPADHPAPVVIGALYEEADPENPGWTIGRFKVTNTGTYEAYGMEARIYATDSDIEITDALVGGSGLVNPDETFDHPDDVFRYRSSGGATPLLEIRYNDPEGLHILLSTVTLATIDEDITGMADLMVKKQRITAHAIETFFYDVEGRLTVGYTNPTNRTVRDAWVVVDWQSLMGDILHHEARQVDLRPGENFASFDFIPKEYLAPINIGGRFKALVRVLDWNGALVDSKVVYGTVWPRLVDVHHPTGPRIELSPSRWDLGSIFIGPRYENSLHILNTGQEHLEIGISSDSLSVSCSPRSISLAPGESGEVQVDLDSYSIEEGPFVSGLTLQSNDSTAPVSGYEITGSFSATHSPLLLQNRDKQRPWDRELLLFGDYSAGAELVFDHDFEYEVSSVVPFVRFDSSRQVLLDYGPDYGAVEHSMEAIGDTQVRLQLKEKEGNTRTVVQFGKAVDHDPISGLVTRTAVIPRETVVDAHLAVALDRPEPDYDNFSSYSPPSSPNPALWSGVSGEYGVVQYQGQNVLSIGSVATSFNGVSRVDTLVDMRNSPEDTLHIQFEFELFTIEHGGPSALFEVGNTYIKRWRSVINTTVRESHDLVLVFDRDQELVTTYIDGVLESTGDISGELNWMVSLIVDTSWGGFNPPTTAHTRVSSVNLYDSNAGFDVGVGSAFDDWVFAIPAENAVRSLIDSPNIEYAVNREIATASQGDAQVPIALNFTPRMKGRSVITDLYLGQSAPSDVNLVLDSIGANAGVVESGGHLSIAVIISNQGLTANQPSICLVSAEDGSGQVVQVGAAVIPVLPSGASATLSVDWDPVSFDGNVSITAVADPLNAIFETAENDNLASTSVLVLGHPDLIVAYVGTATVPGQTGAFLVAVNIAELTGMSSASSQVDFFEQNLSGMNRLVSRTDVDLAPGEARQEQILWVPREESSRICVAVDPSNLVFESNETNNEKCSEVVYVEYSTNVTLVIDAGAISLYDPAFSLGGPFGHLNGNPLLTWGSLPHQSARYSLGGSVLYRFDYLDPGARYHLDATFYEGDGADRVMEIFIDDATSNVSADLSDGLIHRVSATLDPAAYVDDGSIIVDFRRQGPGDALVNEIRLTRVDHTAIDCGDDGTTDSLYSASAGFGYLSGQPSTTWGTTPSTSVRYSTTGEVLYRFDSLDAGAAYKVTATLFEGDGAGRLQTLQVDGEVPSAPISLSATPQVVSIPVPPAAYSADGSILFKTTCTNGRPTAVISELVLEQETLPVQSLSGATVTPDAGTGATLFTYTTTFTDLAGALPDSVSLSVDDGGPAACTALDPADTDTTDGKLYACQASGLSDSLHTYAFSAAVGGVAATGDVGSHTGPLVGGPTLPDAGEYGYLPAGDQTHPDQVIYAFPAVDHTVRLGFDLYDSSTDEVEVWLNGTRVGDPVTTTAAAWGGPQDLILPLSLLRTDTANHIVFRNTVNQPTGTEPWGVRTVSLLSGRPDEVTAVDVGGDDGTAVELSWGLSPDDVKGLDNVAGYRLYRADTPIGPWSQIGSAGPGETLHIDSGLETERTYWYQVDAWNGHQASAVNLTASGAPLDNVAPVIAGASPADGATGVPPGTAVVLHVADSGQGVDPDSLQARVNGGYVNPDLTAVPGGYTVTIVPRGAFAPGEGVTVTLDASDLASPANASDIFTLGFTVGDDLRLGAGGGGGHLRLCLPTPDACRRLVCRGHRNC